MAERKKAPAKGRAKGAYRPLKAPKEGAAPNPGQGDESAEKAAQGEPGNPDEPAAGIGHNNPPPDVLFAEHIDGLFMEAQNFLDGDPISNDEQAEAVTKLKGLLSQAAKDAEAERKKEKQPFIDGGKAVDAKWKPITEKADKAIKVAQRALTPWLEMIEAENRRKADEARRAADEAAERLRVEAAASRESSSLHDEDHREELEREAAAAAKEAREAEKATTAVRTDAGGASLRTYWLVNVKDHRELLTHYLKTRPDIAEALREWLADQAKKDVRAGVRSLPGCSIWSERRAI